MGEVYRARDSRLGREVAIKVLPTAFAASPDRLRRFEREVNVTGALNHPNIVAVHDVGTHEGVPYVVYELLEGQTLRAWLEGASRPAARKCAELALQMARGLAAAHEKGIVHRDLKPENLFVTTDGRLKILDFGLAKTGGRPRRPLRSLAPRPREISSQSTVPWHTNPGTRLGTVAYMSPEQVRGVAVDHRSDIFSFGTVLYEMLSGRPAFRRTTNSETLAAILTEDPPDLSEAGLPLPPALHALVRRCLEKAPAERFQSAQGRGLRPRDDTVGGRLRLPRAGGWDMARPGASRRAAARERGARCPGDARRAPMAGPRGPGSLPRWTPRQLTSDPGWEAEPALSPDGGLVAYSSNRSGQRGHLGRGRTRRYVAPVDRRPRLGPVAGVVPRRQRPRVRLGPARAERDLEGAPGSVARPSCWCRTRKTRRCRPMGTRMAFSRRGRSGQHRIAVAELADLSHVTISDRRQTTACGSTVSPAWSPDGTTLCYADFRDLWLVPAAGRAAEEAHDRSRERRPPRMVCRRTARLLLVLARRHARAVARLRGGRGPGPHDLRHGAGRRAQPV